VSVFNKAGANPRLLSEAMVSSAAVMILLLGPGQKPDADKGEGKADLKGFLIVSQSELPAPNCSGFGGRARRGARTGCGALGLLTLGFFLFNLRCA